VCNNRLSLIHLLNTQAFFVRDRSLATKHNNAPRFSMNAFLFGSTMMMLLGVVAMSSARVVVRGHLHFFEEPGVRVVGGVVSLTNRSHIHIKSARVDANGEFKFEMSDDEYNAQITAAASPFSIALDDNSGAHVYDEDDERQCQQLATRKTIPVPISALIRAGKKDVVADVYVECKV
jgi:hypothetical protein